MFYYVLCVIVCLAACWELFPFPIIVVVVIAVMGVIAVCVVVLGGVAVV